jgi:hypothetical protein
MPLPQARQPRVGRAGYVLASVLCLMILAGGCSAGPPAGTSGQPTSPQPTASQPTSPQPTSSQPTSSATAGRDLRALAAAYLAIAVPANHRLDGEVDGFADHEHDNLAAAKSDLRAQAATERWFDLRLVKIPFPPRIAAVARALVQANDGRIKLTKRQAWSTSISRLRSFTRRHKAADAAVEVRARLIRRDLDLPPPATS